MLLLPLLCVAAVLEEPEPCLFAGHTRGGTLLRCFALLLMVALVTLCCCCCWEEAEADPGGAAAPSHALSACF